MVQAQQEASTQAMSSDRKREAWQAHYPVAMPARGALLCPLGDSQVCLCCVHATERGNREGVIIRYLLPLHSIESSPPFGSWTDLRFIGCLHRSRLTLQPAIPSRPTGDRFRVGGNKGNEVGGNSSLSLSLRHGDGGSGVWLIQGRTCPTAVCSGTTSRCLLEAER